MARMEAGDTIEAQIVSRLDVSVSRDDREAILLFEAQKSRAILYQQSSGATAVDATRALLAAFDVLEDQNACRQEIASLAGPAWSILDDLLEIGSRHHSWMCFKVLYASVKAGREQGDLKALVAGRFLQLLESVTGVVEAEEVLELVLDLASWIHHDAPMRFDELVSLIPGFLDGALEGQGFQVSLQAFLLARNQKVEINESIVHKLVAQLIRRGRYDAEARSVYAEQLLHDPGVVRRFEEGFASLSFVNPDRDIEFDPDLDALNVMLLEHYGDRGWVWRNRGLLLRLRGDSMGAVAALAQAMNISGDPPELMVILSPLLYALGFEITAVELARFAGTDLRERFHLDVLGMVVGDDQDADWPGSVSERLREHLDCDGCPREFANGVRRVVAAAELERGNHQEAECQFSVLLNENPADERSALGVAECRLHSGDQVDPEAFLNARFSDASIPFLEHLLSRIAERAGDLVGALKHNERARASLPAARIFHADRTSRILRVLAERIVRMHGALPCEGPLVSMLRTESGEGRNHALDRLEPDLDRRGVTLGLQLGDTAKLRDVILDSEQCRPEDAGIYASGIRAVACDGKMDDVRLLIEHARSAGCGEVTEILLLEELL